MTPPLPPDEVGTPPAAQAASSSERDRGEGTSDHRCATTLRSRSASTIVVAERRRREQRLDELAVRVEDVDEGRVPIVVTVLPFDRDDAERCA